MFDSALSGCADTDCSRMLLTALTRAVTSPMSIPHTLIPTMLQVPTLDLCSVVERPSVMSSRFRTAKSREPYPNSTRSANAVNG